MWKKIVCISLSLVLFCSVLHIQTAFAEAAAPSVSAKGAVLVELKSGRMLFGKNENQRLPMASTTKIMTALLSVESGLLDKTFEVKKEDIIVEGSSMGLVAGEKLTLRELTYGLMMRSGNDASQVIAAIVGGNKENFVKMMNDKARSLGLKDTSFANPCGLDNPEHFTTAYELSQIASAAMKNADFAEIVGTKVKKITYNNSGYRVMSNSNRLLKTYDGAIGVKTGFTKKSGRCLVSSAMRDGVGLLVVTLSDPSDWDDHKKLLDYGFSLLHKTQIDTSEYGYTLPVVGGLADAVEVKSEGTIELPLLDGEKEKITCHEELPKFLYAPIKEGDIIGRMVYTLGDREIGYQVIRAKASVEYQKPKGFFEKVKDFFDHLFT